MTILPNSLPIKKRIEERIQTTVMIVIRHGKTMNYNIKDILESALQTPHGIALHAEGLKETLKARRQFYIWREKARKEGQKDYDELSFIVWDEDQLLIVPRRNASATVSADFIRPLESFETPCRIKARGKSQVKKILGGEI